MKRDIQRLQTIEMIYMRHTAGYNLIHHRRNEDILEKLNVDTDEEKSAQYEQKWLNLVTRMEDIRYPKQLLGYFKRRSR
jgi:hypothetical protein